MGLANNNIKRYPEYAHACKKDDTITSSEENLYELFPSHHCPDILHIPSTDILIKITRVKKHFAHEFCIGYIPIANLWIAFIFRINIAKETREIRNSRYVPLRNGSINEEGQEFRCKRERGALVFVAYLLAHSPI
mmetsp:Transcript_26378/g.61366  ORF Transcript_26378/g.61366 Transcript_26378/m.61366 type:complete len:135 (+) Transcript_26378:789-1193(+)